MQSLETEFLLDFKEDYHPGNREGLEKFPLAHEEGTNICWIVSDDFC